MRPKKVLPKALPIVAAIVAGTTVANPAKAQYVDISAGGGFALPTDNSHNKYSGQMRLGIRGGHSFFAGSFEVGTISMSPGGSWNMGFRNTDHFDHMFTFEPPLILRLNRVSVGIAPRVGLGFAKDSGSFYPLLGAGLSAFASVQLGNYDNVLSVDWDIVHVSAMASINASHMTTPRDSVLQNLAWTSGLTFYINTTGCHDDGSARPLALCRW